MARKTYTEAQIMTVLNEVKEGATIAATCRKHGIGEPTFFRWREKFAGLEKSDIVKMRALELENARLKRALADSMLDQQILKEAMALLGKR